MIPGGRNGLCGNYCAYFVHFVDTMNALTAHVYDANGQPGLFSNLSQLKWGDEVIVHAYGQAYIYEVRSIDNFVQPDDTSTVYKYEDYPWLTLITCRGYDEDNDSYD